MRSRMIMVLAVAAIVLGGVILVPAAYTRLGSSALSAASGRGAGPAAAPAPVAPPPPPTLAAGPVTVDVGKGHYFAWALLDRQTGTISGSANSATSTNSTESMIKVWIVSDYLRRLGDKQPTAARLKQASTAIRDSNDDAANSLYNASGKTAVTRRMISMCGLTNTKVSTMAGYVGWWSFTQMSAQDAVRLGECVKSGKAAGPKWTKWVLTEMTNVRGTTAKKDQQEKQGGGRWGIIDGLPKEILAQGPVSIKNGWTPLSYDGRWHVNCLAVTDDWVLAVQTRYPTKRGLDYGAAVCESVATQLVAPQVGAALKIPQPLVKG
jgi:hypothetical protein